MKLWCQNNSFSHDPHFVILAWVQSWNIFQKLIKVWSPLEFFSQKHVSWTITFHVICISRFYHEYKVWNIFEILMKVCSPLEFFHKNMAHEQLLFTWSTFRDSNLGTKLKYFWKSHETVKSAWIFSQNHVSRTISFHAIHIPWF